MSSAGRAARPPLPVVQGVPAGPSIARGDDRRVAVGGVVVAAALVALAVGSLGLPEGVRRGIWLPLHLTLAGAAGTAIAALLPFFMAALVAAPPADRRLRMGAIGAVAGGGLAVSAGVVSSWTPVAVLGGVGYVAGIVILAAAAFAPLRRSLGRRRPLVEAAYAAGLAQVAIGALLATMLLSGWTPVAERWVELKPAHGWLNLFGFVTVVVAATLIHLGPTVAGARIRPRRSGHLAIGGLTIGPAVVALGYAAMIDEVARLGAVVVIIGGLGLAVHALVVRRDRGAWTTDGPWHGFTGSSLVAAPLWFAVGIGIAAGRVVWLGADPSAWSIGLVAVPLAIGGVVQVLIGAWSHLVSAIGPGDMAAHARQRLALGRWGRARVVGLNAGTAVLFAGTLADAMPIGLAGLALVAASIVTALWLLGRAWQEASAQPA